MKNNTLSFLMLCFLILGPLSSNAQVTLEKEIKKYANELFIVQNYSDNLVESIKDALVISHDGKRYPFPVPHVMISTFATVEELISTVVEKIEAYKDKFGKYPATIVFDSVSKIFETIHNNCNEKFKGFNNRFIKLCLCLV